MKKWEIIRMTFVMAVIVSGAMFACLSAIGVFSTQPDNPAVTADVNIPIEGFYYPDNGEVSHYSGQLSLSDLATKITEQFDRLEKQVDRQEVLLDYFLKEQGITVKRLEGGRLQLVKDDCIIYEEQQHGIASTTFDLYTFE